MRLLFNLLGGLLGLALVLGTALTLLLARDGQPLVPDAPDLTPAERALAQAWLREARPKRRAADGTITLTLTEREANLLLAYLMDRLGQGRARLLLGEDRAQLVASLALPWVLDGRFVNLDLELSGSGRPPRVERLSLSGLPLPRSLAQTLATRALEALDEEHLLRSIQIEPGRIRVTYVWQPETLAALSRRLLSPQDWEPMLAYQDLLQDDARGHRQGEGVPLAALLGRLLVEAEVRSRDVDPVAENRALILALAAYVNGHYLPRSAENGDTASAAPPAAPRPRRVLLDGRVDLAQHFMTSAAIATRGGDALSELSGLFKEVADSRGGSGFSFADLAADRAGSRFALLATGNPAGARAIQALAHQGLAERDFMPTTDGLPEGLDHGQLVAGLSGAENQTYRRLTSQIDRRIGALPIHPGGGALGRPRGH